MPKQKRYMNRRDVQRAWLQWLTKMEKKYQPGIYKALKQQVKSFTDALRDFDVQGARRAADSEIINRGILNAINKIQREAGVYMARKWYRDLRREVRKYSGIGLNEKWTSDLLNYFREHNVRLVSSITQNIRDILLKYLEEGIEGGLSIPEIADRIEQAGFTRNRSFMIARTELVRGANAGTVIGARELEFETQKEWLTARDHRVRGQMPKDKFSHVALDGDKVNVDEKFNNGEWLDFPGDPNGSAANTINCRCTTLIRPKRDEKGKLIPRSKISIILPGGMNIPRPVVTI